MFGRLGREIACHRLGQGRRRASPALRRRSPAQAFEPRLAAFEQWVLLDLRIDVLCQLEVRKLQHLDRLLQLGRHDQRLRLAKLEPLRITRPVHIPLRSGAAYRLNLSPR